MLNGQSSPCGVQRWDRQRTGANRTLERIKIILYWCSSTRCASISLDCLIMTPASSQLAAGAARLPPARSPAESPLASCLPPHFLARRSPLASPSHVRRKRRTCRHSLGLTDRYELDYHPSQKNQNIMFCRSIPLNCRKILPNTC